MSFIPTSEQIRTGAATGPRAGFWQRLFADLIDSIIIAIAYLILAQSLHTAGTLLGVLIGIAYFTYLEGGPRGQTIGKSAMQIRVVSLTDGQPLGYQRALGRDLARILSAIPLYLGYLWMLWSRERQTWHDTLTHAIVVPTAAYPPPQQ
jgi:uncharacterized RDD family membrane protein YckC